MWSKYQPDQCDSDTLYSKLHLFFKWFYFLSQEVQKKKGFIMENVPSKVVSKAYAYCKLRELPFISVLSKKKFNYLREETLQSIISNKTFAPGKILAKLTSQQVSVVQNFIKQLKQQYKAGTFTPAKYTDKRG